jgi:SulP family sulfate permease
MWSRFKSLVTFFDARFEDMNRENWKSIVYRDFSAGLIVAMTAIPMAMGFAIAMGLRPEQGIIAGAIACMVGRTFGGSKYQVYGPTAAFIPLIAALVAKYGEEGGGTAADAHGFLVFVSIVAGIILMTMGITGMGKFARLVPNSIVVGFTVGIAITIALSNVGEALGIHLPIKGGLITKVQEIFAQSSAVNWFAFGLAIFTFLCTRILLRISVFIPAPLIAIGLATATTTYLLGKHGIVLVKDRFGAIPTNFFVFTPPYLPELTAGVWFDIVYFGLAIVFVSAVESILCSSMADRLADNRKTPFNPNKELWGQGLVQIITPLINGFPCTGALARTATSIKAGAVTPLAGYFKGVLKLTLAYFLASWLEMIPMACIAGILLWVATNMVKPQEIREVWRHNWFHASLMIYTAAMVPLTDFLTGVLSALILYGLGVKFFDSTPNHDASDSQTASSDLNDQPQIFARPALPSERPQLAEERR